MKRSDFIKNIVGFALILAITFDGHTAQVEKVEKILGHKPWVLTPESIEELGRGKRALKFNAKIDAPIRAGQSMLQDETGKSYFVSSIYHSVFGPEMIVVITGLKKAKRKNVTGKQFIIYANAYSAC